MQLIFFDAESYYTDKANGEYSLTWMTNEEYVRDERFESIGFAIAVGNEEPVWYSGDHAYQQSVLNRFDWDDAVVVGHNMSEFDSLILSHHFGIVPRAYACTLQMARRWHGAKVSNSLGNLAKMYNLYAEKGTEVEDARNKRRKDFTDAQLAAYGAYCVKDVKLCRQLYHQFRPRFPADEQRLMSLFTRMYADARLHLDGALIRTMVEDIAVRKSGLLDQVADMLALGVGLPREQRMELVQKELRSDAKFARILDEEFGIDPPTKLSPKQKNADGTPKTVFAFAKTDEAMVELLEDEDPDVQALAAARLGVKSTIAESRLQRFLGISTRGPLPVPLTYGKTHTDRAAGCLVADTKVVCCGPDGLVVEKRIVDVRLDDLVWDGEEFVEHEGVKFQGFAEVIEHDGVTGTEDHPVFTVEGSDATISLAEAKRTGARIVAPAAPAYRAVDVDRARETAGSRLRV